MTTPTFTIDLLDSANLEITLTRVEDTVKKGVYHLFISRLYWKSFLSKTNRTYRVTIDSSFRTVLPNSNYYLSGATAFPGGLGSTDAAGFTGNETINLSADPAVETSNPFTVLNETEGNDVTQASLSAGNYLATFRGGGSDITVNTLWNLQSSTDGGTTWNNITETVAGSGDATDVEAAEFTFPWDVNGTLSPAQNFVVRIVLDGDTTHHSNLPKLVYAATTTTPTAPVTVGYHTYQLADIIPADATYTVPAGADFALWLPRDDNNGGVTDAAVDDFDANVIPGVTYNLFEYTLAKTAFGSAPGGAPSNTTDYVKSTLRNAIQRYYANNNWAEIYISTVVWDHDLSGGTADITETVNATGFTMNSSATTFTLTKSNANNALFTITTSLGTKQKIILKEINVTPFIPGATAGNVALSA